MGKQKKFYKTYSTYYELIIAFAYKLTGDLETAKDVTQEVFINYNNHIGSVENERAWLLVSAKNKCYDFFKKENKETEKIEKLKNQNNETEFSDYYEKVVKVAEKYAENELEKRSFILGAEGFSHDEIAKEIPSTFNKVRYALRKIRERIRNWCMSKKVKVSKLEDLLDD